MQVPSMDVRPLSVGEQVRADEVEISAMQAERIEAIKVELDRQRELASRPRMSRGSRRRK